MDVEMRKNKRGPPADGTVLYLDCGGCYTNLHVMKLNTTTHTHNLSTCVWIVPMSSSQVWYYILAVQNVTIRENWVKDIQDLHVQFFGNFLEIYNYLRIKS